MICFYRKTNDLHQFLIFISFWSSTLHVSDGLSVRHQESKTVHTATDICQTYTADCLLASSQQNLFEIFHPEALPHTIKVLYISH